MLFSREESFSRAFGSAQELATIRRRRIHSSLREKTLPCWSLCGNRKRKFGSSGLSVLTCDREGEGHCWRMPHAGPPWHHIGPEGLRAGGPQLAAGHGRPVCQPWENGDKAEGQHLEAMCFAGSTPSKTCKVRLIRMIRKFSILAFFDQESQCPRHIHAALRFLSFCSACPCWRAPLAPPKSSAPPLTFPATSQVTVAFAETEIPGQCRVFSHLLVSIPSTLSEKEIKNWVEQFGMKNGADYILIGMARESSEGVGRYLFQGIRSAIALFIQGPGGRDGVSAFVTGTAGALLSILVLTGSSVTILPLIMKSPPRWCFSAVNLGRADSSIRQNLQIFTNRWGRRSNSL